MVLTKCPTEFWSELLLLLLLLSFLLLLLLRKQWALSTKHS